MVEMAQKNHWSRTDRRLLALFIADSNHDYREAGEQLGVSHTTVWRWARGDCCPSPLALMGLRKKMYTVIRKKTSSCERKRERSLHHAMG